MPASSDYRRVSLGTWSLVVLPNIWNGDLQGRVTGLVDRQPWAKHPQTLCLPLSSGGKESVLFLKIFHSSRGGEFWKNWFRRSKALQAWNQCVALSGAGFNVPVIVAAGERRGFGGFRRGFILTQRLEGQAAPFFLRDLLNRSSKREWLKWKRAGLKQLANVVRSFHQMGFVHGDLVATNIFVRQTPDDRITVFFMDNDRTRRFPRWLPQSLWKRNLVQLNRLPLPGITLQDRMRFFRAYLQHDVLDAGDRKLACWFERKTRARRKQCDGVSQEDNFRRLMRWSGELPVERYLERAG